MSGRAALAILQSFGFEVHSQHGSHIKLRRMGPNGERQTLTIPDHPELDTGTLRAIIRQAARYVAMDELQRHFYR
jgi:predicted RNA binding protein YcfA (HicA-like mRNA interferase family)